jgi:quercetin dioxygenase-like cupin family protein
MHVKSSLTFAVSCLTLLFAAAEASAEDAFQAVPDPAKLEWADTGPPWPNTQVAVLKGDPSKAESFVIRWRCPDNYKIPPHVHPAAEAVTVLQGTFHIGRGETFDAAALTQMKPGGFMVMPGGTAHFGICKGDTIIELHATGPWGTKMVNQ